jgi:uncharacterized protein
MGHPHGMIGWVDLASTDQGAAETFYVSLFGWEARRQPIPGGGHYVMFELGERAVAGLGEVLGPAPSAWQTYVSVDDVDAVAARVPGASGTVVAPPFDVMGSGRMSVFTDACGALVSAWQAYEHPGAEVFHIPGTYTWSELITHALDKARIFYEQVFAWRWALSDLDGPEYWVASYPGQPKDEGGQAGAGQIGDGPVGGTPSHWVVYFAVEDVDQAAASAVELGARVVSPPSGTPLGRQAALADPTGGVFRVIRPAGGTD